MSRGFALVILLLLSSGSAPSAQSIRFVFPTPWSLVQDIDGGLRVRVDATDFKSIWLDTGCSLSLMVRGIATETDRMNASFHMEESLAYGFHKLGAMVRDYDGEVLAIASVIFIYAPPELYHKFLHVPLPVPVRSIDHEIKSTCRPNRRVVIADVYKALWRISLI